MNLMLKKLDQYIIHQFTVVLGLSVFGFVSIFLIVDLIENLDRFMDNKVPFYVALPSSTIDWDIKDFKNIPIEERNSEELSHIEGLDDKGKIKKVQIYPTKSKAMNLAFDVTPAKYVTGLITEKGVCEASNDALQKMFK